MIIIKLRRSNFARELAKLKLSEISVFDLILFNFRRCKCRHTDSTAGQVGEYEILNLPRVYVYRILGFMNTVVLDF